MDSPASQFVAVAAFAATRASTRNARAYCARGDLDPAGDALEIATLSGEVLFAPVVARDEPVAFAGDLVVDQDARTAVFTFGGSAVKRTGAFTFDVETGNLWSGMVVHDSGEAGTMDVLSGYEFSLAIDADTGVGTFSYLRQDALAEGLKIGTVGTVRVAETASGGKSLELTGVVYGAAHASEAGVEAPAPVGVQGDAGACVVQPEGESAMLHAIA